jgi:transposase-like protein
MNCQACQTPGKRHGVDRKGVQRYFCRTCRKIFSEGSDRRIRSM